MLSISPLRAAIFLSAVHMAVWQSDLKGLVAIAITTGDYVVTECHDNYRVSKVGALGKHYLPSANTRNT